MFELKKLSAGAIESALSKVERYRLLNEPAEAASICHDILDADPGNQTATVMLILSLSDQFARDRKHVKEALDLLPSLTDPYDRLYYAGLVYERRAKTRHELGGPAANHAVHQWIVHAMGKFAEAEALRVSGNDDPLLRWNACARFLMRHPEVCAEPDEQREAVMSE